MRSALLRFAWGAHQSCQELRRPRELKAQQLSSLQSSSKRVRIMCAALPTTYGLCVPSHACAVRFQFTSRVQDLANAVVPYVPKTQSRSRLERRVSPRRKRGWSQTTSDVV